MDKSLLKYFYHLCEIYIVLNSFVISIYINKIYIKFYTYVHEIEIKSTEIILLLLRKEWYSFYNCYVMAKYCMTCHNVLKKSTTIDGRILMHDCKKKKKRRRKQEQKIRNECGYEL